MTMSLMISTDKGNKIKQKIVSSLLRGCNQYSELSNNNREKEFSHLFEAVDLFFDWNGNEFVGKVSEQWIIDEFYSIIRFCGNLEKDKREQKIRDRFQDVVNRARNPTDYVFFLRLANLDVAQQYTFGEAQILPNNSESLNLLNAQLKLFQGILPMIERDFSEEKEKFSSFFVIPLKTSKPYTEYDERNKEGFRRYGFSWGDTDNARDIGLTKANQFINILSIFENNMVYVEGNSDIHRNVHYLVEKELPLITSSGKKLNPDSEKIISLDNILSKNSPFCSDILNLLYSDKKSPIEQKIVNSALWLGEGLRESELHHILLKLIISLESLLLTDKEKSSNKIIISDRAAFYLGNDEWPKRKIYETVIFSYNLRNRIVHNGLVPNFRFKLIVELKQIIIELMKKIRVDERITSFDDFIQIIENKKYGEMD